MQIFAFKQLIVGYVKNSTSLEFPLCVLWIKHWLLLTEKQAWLGHTDAFPCYEYLLLCYNHVQSAIHNLPGTNVQMQNWTQMRHSWDLPATSKHSEHIRTDRVRGKAWTPCWAPPLQREPGLVQRPWGEGLQSCKQNHLMQCISSYAGDRRELILWVVRRDYARVTDWPRRHDEPQHPRTSPLGTLSLSGAQVGWRPQGQELWLKVTWFIWQPIHLCHDWRV